MRVRMTLIEVGAIGTIPQKMEKGLEHLEIEGRIKTIQNTERSKY